MLTDSAEARGTTQGIETFSAYAKRFEEKTTPEHQHALMREMYHELAGFQRFADLSDEEDRIRQSLFELCR